MSYRTKEFIYQVGLTWLLTNNPKENKMKVVSLRKHTLAPIMVPYLKSVSELPLWGLSSEPLVST